MCRPRKFYQSLLQELSKVAKQYFEFNLPDKDGHIKANHVNHLIDQGRDISVPDTQIPEIFLPAFGWWCEIHKEREVGFSLTALKTDFILRWLNIYGIIPLDIELKAVRLIDDAYIEVSNGFSDTANKGGQPPSRKG